MKSTTIFLYTLLCLSLNALAQTRRSEKIENKDGEIRIIIEEESKGSKRLFEKSYATKGMTDAERQALIDRVRDSLATKGFTKKNKAESKSKIQKDEDDVNIDLKISPEGDKQSRNYRFKGNKGESFENQIERFAEDFGRDMERFGNRMERQFSDKNYHFEFNDDSLKNKKGKGKTFYFNMGEGSNTIQNLKVYPNNPFNNVLNIKFLAPEKGDIVITVTDVSGKQVGQDRIKDFSGNYVGQIALKAVEKGTLFVNVTQGKDGETKRVVVE